MKKRGASFKMISSILISIVVLGVISYFFFSVKELGEKANTAEIINFKTTLQTEVLQQNSRVAGSTSNISLSVPGGVSKIYLFDSDIGYDSLKAPELVQMYQDNEEKNLFFKTKDTFISYSVPSLIIDPKDNPIVLKSENNRLELKLEKQADGVIIDAPQEMKDSTCISVLNNGIPENKIDIVFLNYGFENIEDFSEQVNRYANNILLEFEPFKEYKEKFNFYRIDHTDIDCRIGSFIDCDQFQIKLEASDCPNDFIVLLVSRNKVKDFIRPVRSSAIGKITKINTADKPFVLVHEFGHSFGNLADEYVDESYYSRSNFDADLYANCDSSPCPSWQSIENTSCYEGCSLDDYFRSTENSIMRSLSSPTFGPLNERELLKRLLYYE